MARAKTKGAFRSYTGEKKRREAEAGDVAEMIKNAPYCEKCHISSALCDCPGRYSAASQLASSDLDTLAIALLGRMRNLWADETEIAVRAAQLAERRRLAARLRAMPEEVRPRCPPMVRVAFLDAADSLDGVDREGPVSRRVSSHSAGGCNFCNRHISAVGSIEHTVTEITCQYSGGIRVRFCDECLRAVRNQTKVKVA